MATIVFLEHRHQAELGIHYMAYEFARRWQEQGHRVLYHRGLGTPPAGDLAIVHHDLTVIPEPYLELASRFPRVVNAATGDIRKSRYSDCRVFRGDPWPGRVLIKSEANHGGHVDDALRRAALSVGEAPDIDEGVLMDDYYLCESMSVVPQATWAQPGVIVEKFVAEEDATGSYLRVWTFFGDKDRSTRYRARVPLIRFADCFDPEPVAVPDELRALRARLRFDYGKFDYVRHEGRYYLLDANRTPGAPDAFAQDTAVSASLDRLSLGLQAFL